MERGFDETGMCSAGAEEFKQVIQQGESLLAGAQALPASTLTSLHFMVGDAYATIVWLAKTTDSEYHDPKEYQPMAESARTRSLAATWPNWAISIAVKPTNRRIAAVRAGCTHYRA
jgi:hypothetical protein